MSTIKPNTWEAEVIEAAKQVSSGSRPNLTEEIESKEK